MSSVGWSAGLSAQQLEAGPVGVDSADLHVDKAHGEAEAADAVFREIDEKLRGFLRP